MPFRSRVFKGHVEDETRRNKEGWARGLNSSKPNAMKTLKEGEEWVMQGGSYQVPRRSLTMVLGGANDSRPASDTKAKHQNPRSGPRSGRSIDQFSSGLLDSSIRETVIVMRNNTGHMLKNRCIPVHYPDCDASPCECRGDVSSANFRAFALHSKDTCWQVNEVMKFDDAFDMAKVRAVQRRSPGKLC